MAPILALIILSVCVVGLYGGIFTMNRYPKVSNYLFGCGFGGFVVFIVFLFSLMAVEERLPMGIGLVIFVGCIFFTWAHFSMKFKEKKKPKKRI